MDFFKRFSNNVREFQQGVFEVTGLNNIGLNLFHEINANRNGIPNSNNLEEEKNRRGIEQVRRYLRPNIIMDMQELMEIIRREEIVFNNFGSLLVTDITPELDTRLLKTHLELKTNGTIILMQKISDGVLFIFNDLKCIDKITRKKFIKYEKKKFPIFSKPLPAIESKMFILQGITDQKETYKPIVNFLNNMIRKLEAKPNRLNQNPERITSTSYLVFYNDTDVAQKLRKKVEENKDDISSITSSRAINITRTVYQTDCIKVEKFPDGTNEKEIKSFFSRKKDTGGKNPTHVITDKCDNKIFYVFFANFNDVNNVIDLDRKCGIHFILRTNRGLQPSFKLIVTRCYTIPNPISVKLDEEKMYYCEKTGWFEELKAKFSTDVKLHLDKERKEMFISLKQGYGDSKVTDRCMTEVKEYMKCILSTSFGNELTKEKRSFVVFCLNQLTEKIFKAYTDKFKKNRIQAILQLTTENSFKAIYHNSTNEAHILVSLNELILSEEFNVNFESLIKDKKWQKLIQELYSDGVYYEQDTNSSKLKIFCLENIEEAKNLINQYLKSVTISTVSINCSIEKYIYCKYYYKFDFYKIRYNEKSVEVETKYGKKKEAEEDFRKKLQHLMVIKEAIKHPLMSIFLKSNEGLKLLEKLAEKHKAVILLFVNNKIVNLKFNKLCEPVNELIHQRQEVTFFEHESEDNFAKNICGERQQASSFKKKSTKKKTKEAASFVDKAPNVPKDVSNTSRVCNYFNLNNVEIRIVVGDITSHNVDAVIISNFNFQGPLLNCVLTKGGNDLKSEFDAKRQQNNNVFLTKGYSLPYDYVVHMSLPNDANKCKPIVEEGFKMILNQNIKSFAVPCIGGSRLTPLDVAKLIVESLANTTQSSSSLTHIHIVLYNKFKQNKFEEPIRDELKQRCKPMNNNSNTSTATTSSKIKTGLKDTTSTDFFDTSIKIIEGDITKQKVDVIFVRNFNFQGHLLEKIFKKGGKEIKKDFDNQRKRNENIFLTKGYKLDCKYVVHMNIGSGLNEIKAVMENAFKMLDREIRNYMYNDFKVKTIAVPAIGGHENEPSDVAKATVQSIANAACSILSLDEIRIVLREYKKFIKFYKHELKEIKDELAQEMGNQSKYTHAKYSETSTSLGINKTEIVEVLFCSENTNCANNALKDLEKYEEENIIEEPLEHVHLKNYVVERSNFLKNLETKYNVTFINDLLRDESRLILQGFKNTIYEAKSQLHSDFVEFQSDLLCSMYVQWYKKEKKGKWEELDAHLNNIFETNYKKNKDDQKTELLDTKKGKTYIVNFKEMTYHLESTFKIKRELVGTTDEAYALPNEWDSMKNESIKTVKVDKNSEEYKTVLEKFTKKGVTISEIVQLLRIQNSELHKQFAIQKLKIIKKKRSDQNNVQIKNQSNDQNSDQYTLDLFHGTREDAYKKIIYNGFDRNYSGRNATYYGKGVYFATQSSYSDKYAFPAKNDGVKRMFLAEVVIGECCLGEKNMQTIPIKKGTNEAYDCAVDQLDNPTMYVVFKDSSAYAHYMLEYK